MIPFFDEHGLRVDRMLTDRGTEYCGAHEDVLRSCFEQLRIVEKMPGMCSVYYSNSGSEGAQIGMINRSLPGLNNPLCLAPALVVMADQIAEAIDGALREVCSG